MAGSWSFFPDAGTIVLAAFRRIRAIDPEDANGTSLIVTQKTNALQTLNFWLSSMQAHGLQVWCNKENSGTLVLGQKSYTIGSGGNLSFNRPIYIEQAWTRDTSITPNLDIPIRLIGQEEYNALSVKDVQGVPISAYYQEDYQGSANEGPTSTGTLFMWPTADSYSATNRQLWLSYVRPLEDMNALTDKLDLPQEWLEAARLNLAYKLAPEWGMPMLDYRELKNEAKEALDLALSWSTNKESIQFVPNTDRMK